MPFLRGVLSLSHSLTLSPPCRRHQWSSEVASNHLRAWSAASQQQPLVGSRAFPTASQSHAMVPQQNKPLGKNAFSILSPLIPDYKFSS